MYKLDPAIKHIWTYGYIISSFVYSFIMFILDFLILRKGYFYYPFGLGVLSLIVLVAGLIISFVYPQFKYKYFTFEVKDNELIINRGILTRIKTLMPYSKLQHIDLRQSIFDRMYNLAKLTLYTAGTYSNVILLPGLPLQYAEELKEALKNITSDESL